MMDYSEYEQFARQLCVEAGQVVRPLFRNPQLRIELKADGSPVTHADRQAEKRMRQLIAERYPDHGVIGEEHGSDRADAEFVWVLDPIDGTKSFAAGAAMFGTLVCLLHQGQPVLGAIYQPILQQLMIGNGQRAWLNDRPAQLRATPHLAEATLLVTDFLDVGRHRSAAGFDELANRVALVRTWGDCYGYLLLASGYADIMLDAIMAPWDLLALIPVVRGAGGVITDWLGHDPATGDSIVAAAPELHERVIRILNP